MVSKKLVVKVKQLKTFHWFILWLFSVLLLFGVGQDILYRGWRRGLAFGLRCLVMFVIWMVVTGYHRVIKIAEASFVRR